MRKGQEKEKAINAAKCVCDCTKKNLTTLTGVGFFSHFLGRKIIACWEIVRLRVVFECAKNGFHVFLNWFFFGFAVI